MAGGGRMGSSGCCSGMSCRRCCDLRMSNAICCSGRVTVMRITGHHMDLRFNFKRLLLQDMLLMLL